MKLLLGANTKKIIFGVIGLAVALLFIAISCLEGLGIEGIGIEGLSAEGTRALGIFLMAVLWWAGDVFPDYVTALWLMSLLILTNTAKLSVVFGAYSESIIWIIVPTLAIGAALSKSGLLRRMVLKILSMFKGDYKSQILAFLVAGNIINPFIPSTTAKVAITAPLAQAYSEEMGFKAKSKPAAGIFSAMWSAFGAAGPIFLTGTFMCFVMIGLLPEGYASGWTFFTWTLAIFPWGIVWFIMSFIFINLLYRPKNYSPLSSTYRLEQYKKLGKMSRAEKICLVVLLVCVLLWVTESLHGIITAVVALLGMAVLLSFKVIDKETFRSNIAWDIVVFIACNISIGTVFNETGVTSWIGMAFEPFLEPIFSNVFLLIVVSVIGIALLRFIIVSQTALMTIFIVVCTPFSISNGMSPFIAGLICLVSINIWNVRYQNTTMVTALAASKDMAEFSDVRKMSLVYMGACILGMILCVPLWGLLGLL